MKISVVVPLFNEERCIQAFWQRLRAAINRIPFDFEVIFIDDASQDQTWRGICQIHKQDSRVKGIRLGLHGGHQVAFFAGLRQASGHAVIMMDGDLQHPPEKIPTLIQEWKKGVDLVYGFKTSQAGRGFLKKYLNQLFHWLLSIRSGVFFHPETSDFQILDRKLVEKILATWQPSTFLRGWIHRQATGREKIPFDAARRYGGKSRQSPIKLTGLGIQTLLCPTPSQSSKLSSFYQIQETVGCSQ